MIVLVHILFTGVKNSESFDAGIDDAIISAQNFPACVVSRWSGSSKREMIPSL